MDLQAINGVDTDAPINQFNLEDGTEEDSEIDPVPMSCCQCTFYRIYYTEEDAAEV